MCTADQLQPLIFSWIEEPECCADPLGKLAKELESLTEKCKAGECVGSSVAVVVAACVIAALLATLFTAGTAALFLGMLRAAYTGTGVAVSVGAKIINSFLSSDTMKEAKEVEKRSNEIADKIHTDSHGNNKAKNDQQGGRKPGGQEQGGQEQGGQEQGGQEQGGQEQGGQEQGGQEQGGDNGGDPGGDPQGGDAGGQRSDSDKDESDTDEDESDTDEDDSDTDEEDSSSYDRSHFTCQPIIYEVECRVECSDFSSDPTSLPHISKHEDSEKIHQKTVSELSAPWCEIGVFNTRSINTKQPRLSKFIKKFKLLILMITETWVKPENGDQRIGEILPEEFQFDQKPREGGSGRGGGVAILFSNDLQRVPSEDRSFESFEHLAREVRYSDWARPMWTITVYRPPRRTVEDMKKFEKEFQNYLDRFSKDDAILITGDFNIRVNDSNDKHAKWFKKLLDANGLCLHVKEATHEKHNILDLVITRNVDICNLRVKKPITKINETTKKKTKISDHYAIIFSARPTADKKSKDREE